MSTEEDQIELYGALEGALLILQEVWDDKILEVIKKYGLDINKKIDNPFNNVGYKYNGNKFTCHAYDWSGEGRDGFFKYKDIHVTWYKWLGRGSYQNREVSAKEVLQLLDDCLEEIEVFFNTKGWEKET